MKNAIRKNAIRKNAIRVSIILCTYNRAEHLRQTLESLGRVCIPEALPAEVIVVDNGSTDGTAALVRGLHLPNMPVRYLLEPRQGKSHGLNRAMAHAEGDVFLFTDDDLRFPENWLMGMCEPIQAGRAEAVAGGVVLAPHLMRDWMEAKHQWWLASTGSLAEEKPTRMVGANMAFSRKVLEKVPQFDEELGPGALGLGEETLFTYQLVQAGFRVEMALDVCVEHHFEASRLARANFVSSAQKIGRAEAYVAYHWMHLPPKPLLRRFRLWGRLLLWHLRRRVQHVEREGMPLWEMSLLNQIAADQQVLVEIRRPRNYEKFGVVKLLSENDFA